MFILREIATAVVINDGNYDAASGTQSRIQWPVGRSQFHASSMPQPAHNVYALHRCTSAVHCAYFYISERALEQGAKRSWLMRYFIVFTAMSQHLQISALIHSFYRLVPPLLSRFHRSRPTDKMNNLKKKTENPDFFLFWKNLKKKNTWLIKKREQIGKIRKNTHEDKFHVLSFSQWGCLGFHDVCRVKIITPYLQAIVCWGFYLSSLQM